MPNQAEIILNSLSPDVQGELFELVKKKIPRGENAGVKFDVPGQRAEIFLEGFVDVKTVCEFLGVKKNVVYNMINCGEVPYYEAGRQKRLRLSEIAEAVRRK